MADIFLSYSRADRPKAQQIAQSLEREGFSVWWDKVLRAGQTYDEVTEGMLRDARIVVVLWSEGSVKSKWVRAEATLGQRSSTVIPAMIENAERPIMFELTQTADLVGWDGDRDEARWKDFVADIRLALESSTAARPETTAPAIPAVDATIETTFWNSISDSGDAADFEVYVGRYPNGHFVDLARNRLASMSRAASAKSTPPPPAPPSSAPAPAQPKQPSAAPPPAKKFPLVPVLAGVAVIVVGVIAGLSLMPKIGGTAEIEAAKSETTNFSDCDICPAMVPLAGGTFMMGSPDTESGRTGNESPQHEVTVAPFAIGELEITFDQWDACVADGGCANYSPPDRDYGRGTQPVIGVSWLDAGAYTQWLSRKTGRPYRLPTEAEWEFAARGGTTTAYWWGDTFDPRFAPSSVPVPPDTLDANPFGLKAMLGNAREWVEDCYVNNYANAPSDGRAVQEGDCARRVLRGGAWGRDSDDHRAANRARIDRNVRDKVFGFRVATSQLPADE